jgi:5-methylcytosine-specific restriction endonuclease McrA
MSSNLKTQIEKLRDTGLDYREISRELGCSISTICYHLGEGQKEKSAARLRKRRSDPVSRKIETFLEISGRARHCMFTKTNRFHSENGKNYKGLAASRNFNPKDVLEKYGSSCYLTGRQIDYEDSLSYELDHIVPRSQDGDSSLENCGLACKAANRAKHDMSLEEFFQLCIDVVKHNNLKV